MEKLRKILIVFAILTALLVGVVTTAMAGYAVDEAVAVANGDLTLEEKKQEIEAGTPLSQYDLPVVVGPFTWDPGSREANPSNWRETDIGLMMGKVEGVNHIGLENDPTGNPVFTLRYNGQKEREYEQANGSLHTYAYIRVGNRTQANNLVMEFDITTFGNKLPRDMGIEHSNVINEAGVKAQPRLLEISESGVITPSYTGDRCQSGYELTAEEKARLAKHVITKDKWTHITMLYDSTTCFVTLYIDYEYICSYDTRPKGLNHYQLTVFRLGTANPDCVDGELSLDNFIAYEGSYIRTPDLFTKKNDHERFVYYVSCMSSDRANITDRMFCYNKVKSSIGNYWKDQFIPVSDSNMDPDALAELNATLEKAVNDYHSFMDSKYNELHLAYITENLKTFEGYVNELKTYERNLSNIAERKRALEGVQTFLAEVGEANILKSAESNYNSVKAVYDAFVTGISNDELIFSFCDEVDAFYRSVEFSYPTLQARFAKAEEILLQLDTSVDGAPGFDRFTEAMVKYREAVDILESKLLIQNAKKIIRCIDLIDEYTTVEEWIANYDYMDRYIVIVRNIVRENRFDTEFEGVSEALEFYYTADEYFYAHLQQEHINTIRELLDRYIASSGYIEKVALCTSVEAYIASVDIDLELPDIAAAIIELETYKSELELSKADYNEVLVQNTAIFKNTIRAAMIVSTYAERLALYETANKLYFAMNAGDESIAEELAYYDVLVAELTEAQKASEAFVVAVETLKLAANDDELYATLVDCYILSLSAEPDIEGVSEAMEYFLAEYNAYNASVAAVNDELSGSYVAVGSLRANCGVGEILAIIIKKFE